MNMLLAISIFTLVYMNTVIVNCAFIYDSSSHS